MYGLIGRLQARSGHREELLTLLQEAAQRLAGNEECLQWLIHASAGNEDDVWITEVWTTEEAHDASLQEPAIRDIIGRAVPLLAQAPQAGAATRLRGGFARDHP